MNRIASLTQKATLQEYAQGAAQGAVKSVADFLAPTVNVGRPSGLYKIYSAVNRFKLPTTLRPAGARATVLAMTATDGTYNCQAHGLDFPVDEQEQDTDEGLENLLREGADLCAETAALVHEKTVIDLALSAAGSGTAKTWNAASDPVADVDAAILAVMKAAKFGSFMDIGVLFGANAWTIFKNASAVKSRFVIGNKGGLAVATEGIASQLFTGTPEVRTSYMVYDSAADGVAENINFVLGTSVLVFARKANPTRQDPSFMKTFRLAGKYMVPGSYTREDGRGEVAKFDWSEDVKVTNSAAVVRYVIS